MRQLTGGVSVITAGRDGCYGSDLPADYFTNTGFVPAVMNAELRLLPSCQRLRPFGSSDSIESEKFDRQLDNQTNFTTGKVGDDKP